jgi:hypothetical protein
VDSRTRGKLKVMNKDRERRYGRDTTLVVLNTLPGGDGLAPVIELLDDWTSEHRTRFALSAEFREFLIGDPLNLMRPHLVVASQMVFSHREGGTHYPAHLDGLHYSVIERFPPDGTPLVWLVRCQPVGKKGKG